MPEELLFVLGFDGPGIVVYQGFAAVPTKIQAKQALDLHFLKPQTLLLCTNCVVLSLVRDA